MALYGYWRCSTDLQDQERQVIALKEEGVPEENIYGDKLTGTSNYGDKEELSKCLDLLELDDLLILEDLTRLGRTMVTMLVEVNNLIERGGYIKTPDRPPLAEIMLCTANVYPIGLTNIHLMVRTSINCSHQHPQPEESR